MILCSHAHPVLVIVDACPPLVLHPCSMCKGHTGVTLVQLNRGFTFRTPGRMSPVMARHPHLGRFLISSRGAALNNLPYAYMHVGMGCARPLSCTRALRKRAFGVAPHNIFWWTKLPQLSQERQILFLRHHGAWSVGAGTGARVRVFKRVFVACVTIPALMHNLRQAQKRPIELAMSPKEKANV